MGALLLAATLLFGACGGGGEGEDEAAGTDDSTPTDTATPDETATVDDGLTDPGTELDLGEVATFTWQPKRNLEGRLELSVDRADLTTMKDFQAYKVSKRDAKATPYYVHVTVKNVGETNMSGVDLPLYLDDGSNVLTPSARFTAAYKKCPSTPLPKKFGPGKEASLCLVYLAPQRAELSAMIVRPDEQVAPISWTGEVTKPKKPKKKKQQG